MFEDSTSSTESEAEDASDVGEPQALGFGSLSTVASPLSELAIQILQFLYHCKSYACETLKIAKAVGLTRKSDVSKTLYNLQQRRYTSKCCTKPKVMWSLTVVGQSYVQEHVKQTHSTLSNTAEGNNSNCRNSAQSSGFVKPAVYRSQTSAVRSIVMNVRKTSSSQIMQKSNKNAPVRSVEDSCDGVRHTSLVQTERSMSTHPGSYPWKSEIKGAGVAAYCSQSSRTSADNLNVDSNSCERQQESYPASTVNTFSSLGKSEELHSISTEQEHADPPTSGYVTYNPNTSRQLILPQTPAQLIQVFIMGAMIHR